MAELVAVALIVAAALGVRMCVSSAADYSPSVTVAPQNLAAEQSEAAIADSVENSAARRAENKRRRDSVRNVKTKKYTGPRRRSPLDEPVRRH